MVIYGKYMKKLTVSAPGKVILMGEHAVVHGKPALISAINKRLYVTLEPGKDGLEIDAGANDGYVRHAVEVALSRQEVKKSMPGLKVKVKSDMLPGYHLGTSAAVAVAVSAAVTFFYSGIWDLDLINSTAYEIEKKMHGTPSGADNTAVTYGHMVWYRKEIESLKIFWPLDINIPVELDNFYLVDTGKPQENTREMISLVRAGLEKHPQQFARIFDENENQTKKLFLALENKAEDEMISAINSGQATLDKMGVVGPGVKPLIRAIAGVGAAKILGGGGLSAGVGYLLAYSADKYNLNRICREFNFKYEKISLNAPGVKLENNL